MRTIFLILLFTISIGSVWAQSVNRSRPGEKFAYLEDATDTLQLRFVRTFKCISKEGDDIQSLFRSIRIQSENLGANCYKFRSFNRDSNNVMSLILSAYIANDSMINVNFRNHERNVVYVFSNDKKNHELHSFQVDGEKKSIHSGSYCRMQIPKYGELKVNKGGFTGTTVTFKSIPGQLAAYLTISGFALADPHGYPAAGFNNTIGVGFTTGRINTMENDVARLLVKILDEYK